MPGATRRLSWPSIAGSRRACQVSCIGCCTNLCNEIPFCLTTNPRCRCGSTTWDAGGKAGVSRFFHLRWPCAYGGSTLREEVLPHRRLGGTRRVGVRLVTVAERPGRDTWPLCSSVRLSLHNGLIIRPFHPMEIDCCSGNS